MDNATIRTKQRDNAVITMSKLTLHESEAIRERLFPTPARLGSAVCPVFADQGRQSLRH
jgi:hypothetical protein